MGLRKTLTVSPTYFSLRFSQNTAEVVNHLSNTSSDVCQYFPSHFTPTSHLWSPSVYQSVWCNPNNRCSLGPTRQKTAAKRESGSDGETHTTARFSPWRSVRRSIRRLLAALNSPAALSLRLWISSSLFPLRLKFPRSAHYLSCPTHRPAPFRPASQLPSDQFSSSTTHSFAHSSTRSLFFSYIPSQKTRRSTRSAGCYADPEEASQPPRKSRPTKSEHSELGVFVRY